MCMTVSACHLNVTESIARLKDTEVMTLKVHPSTSQQLRIRLAEAVWYIGRSRRALCLCCHHRRATFSFSADARSHGVLTACHSDVSVTERRPVKFPSSGNS